MFKKGDKVIMPKYVKNPNSFASLGYQKMFGDSFINEPLVVDMVSVFKGEDVISLQGHSSYMPVKFFERYIEPKFKVGYKFYARAGGYVTEIVKVILNKKKGVYYYACFDSEDGFARFSDENEVASSKKFVEEKIKEMTVDEISKALGYKIKIKK